MLPVVCSKYHIVPILVGCWQTLAALTAFAGYINDMIRKRLVLAGITGVPCFMIGTFLFTSLHSDGNLKPSEIAVVSAPEKQATVSNSFKSVPATRRFARQFSSECVFDLDHSSTFGLIPGRDRTPITKLAVASPAL